MKTKLWVAAGIALLGASWFVATKAPAPPQAAAPFVAPIGIPAPSFGINEQPGAATGTVPSSSSVSVGPGQVLTASGTHGSKTVTCSGTAANPGFIVGPAQATGSWGLFGSYCILEGVNFTGGASIGISGHHIAVRNLDIGGIPSQSHVAAVGIEGASDIVVRGLTIHDIGDVNASFDQDSNGISIGINSQNIWILENDVARVSGDGFTVNPYPYTAANARTTHHIYIGRNTSHHNKQTGFWTKMAADIILSQNVAHGMRPSDSHYGAGFGYQYGTERAWYLYNEAYDSTVGIGVSGDLNLGQDGQNAYMVGNRIHDLLPGAQDGGVWASAAIRFTGGQRAHIVANQFTNVPSGIHITRSAGLFHGGNTFSGLGSGGVQVRSESPVTVVTAESVYATFQSLYGLNIRPGAASPSPTPTPTPTPSPTATPTPTPSPTPIPCPTVTVGENCPKIVIKSVVMLRNAGKCEIRIVEEALNPTPSCTLIIPLTPR